MIDVTKAMEQAANTMETVELTAEAREQTGKGISRRLRREGKIPAILYGKGQDNKILSVAQRDVDKILRAKLGMNTLIKLGLGKDAAQLVMIKDYQGNALTRALTHVDFLLVDESKDIMVSIPVRFTGKAEGVTMGGIMDVVTREVELICKPGRIPQEIIADVTKLAIGQNLHLADITLPEGSRRKTTYNPTLVTIASVREEVAAVAAVAAPVEGAAAAGTPAAPGAAAAAPAKGAAAPAAAGKDAKGAAAAPAKGAAPAAKAAPAKDAKKK